MYFSVSLWFPYYELEYYDLKFGCENNKNNLKLKTLEKTDNWKLIGITPIILEYKLITPIEDENISRRSFEIQSY